MKLSKLYFSFFIMAFIGLYSQYAYAQIEGVKKIASVEGITEYQLTKNGFKFLLFPESSKPTITVNITYLVGSRHEGYGETGMAHLLEHLVFKGTPKHTNIPAELTSHGARPNGTTWLDRTNYFETFSATDENLEWALDLESDRMLNSFIAKKDLESEMTVVRNEFEMGENNPQSVLSERVVSTAFLWNNYGNSTIGARSDIENVPIERLQAFYKKYYQPDNSVLLVAGKIDVDKTLKLIKKYFENLPLPNRNLDKLYPTYTSEPTQDGERNVTLNRVGDVQAIDIVYHISPQAHPDYVPTALLLDLVTDEPSGVLYKDLVESKNATYVYGYALGLKEPGIAEFGCQVPMDKSLDEAKKILISRLDQIATMKFTQQDLDRQKQKNIKNWEMLFNNVEKVGTSISEYIAKGDWRLLFIERDEIKKVTLDDIYRVAAKYFKKSNRTVGLFIPDKDPERAEIPESVDVAMLVKDYKGQEMASQGEDFDPSTQNIDKRTSTINTKQGLELAFLPKETRGDVVNATITLRIGDALSLKNKATLSEIVASMLTEGSKTKTKQQIQDEFDRLNAKVNIGGGGNSVYVSIQTKKENLKDVINIVEDILKNPTFPKNEYDILINRSITEIESQKSEPNDIASRELTRALKPYPKEDVRYTPTFDEEIAAVKAVTIDDVKKFHKDFYGASSATISVVGDFDKITIEKELISSFADWKNKMPFKRIENKYNANPGEVKEFNTPDKSNSLYLAGINLNLQDTDPDYPALVMANYIFGGGFLNSRLATRVRQKDGLSYGVGSGVTVSALDKSGSFTVYAISAPENTKKVNQAVIEEIERVKRDGFTKDELEESRKGFLQSKTVTRSQDPSLTNILNSNLFNNRSMKFDEEVEKKIQALTVEDINKIFNKYVDASKLTTIMAGDFEKVKQSKP